MELLLNGFAWVCLKFSDGTCRLIHTSLNKDKLASVGAEVRDGFFFDVDHFTYEPYREDACEVEVYESKPLFDSEVLNFASRFI